MILGIEALGVTFQNPVFLAAGTCGFGMELEDVLDLEALGGFVTKSVTLEPRGGNAPPRVTEFVGGMLNSIGLANPGVDATLRDKLPWIARNVRQAKVMVSVAGHTVEEFETLVERLDGADGFLGFEVNLSCPNDADRSGPPFALDPDAVGRVLDRCRARTDRPLVAKLAPNDTDLATTVRRAEGAGADGFTVANTMPGFLVDSDSGRAALGAGPGGMSGPALRPAGLRAVREVRAATGLPIFGVGGVMAPLDAIAYARVGADMVQMGTASFAWPRAASELVRGLEHFGRRDGVRRWSDLRAGGVLSA